MLLGMSPAGANVVEASGDRGTISLNMFSRGAVVLIASVMSRPQEKESSEIIRGSRLLRQGLLFFVKLLRLLSGFPH